MVPFCRTVEEGKKVLQTMKEFGLERGKNGLQVYVMCEIPSNVILAEEFCKIFDGFSIGSNDLTQLTLGVDRDSTLVSHVYDEKNEAVKILIRQVIQVAHKNKKKVGICGQAPSDYPEFAEFLVQEGIDSISLNPDTVLSTRKRIASMEKKISRKNNGKLKKITLTAKAILIFVSVGLATALGGYGCQTINNEAIEQKMQQTLQNNLVSEVAKLKGQLRKDITEELTNQLPKTSYYSEDSFVKLTMLYPMNWGLEHKTDYIKFKSIEGNNWFTIQKQTETYGGVPSSSITDGTWMKYKTKKFKVRDNNAVETMILEIYPDGYDKKGIIEISGDIKNFEENLKNISVFKVN